MLRSVHGTDQYESTLGCFRQILKSIGTSRHLELNACQQHLLFSVRTENFILYKRKFTCILRTHNL